MDNLVVYLRERLMCGLLLTVVLFVAVAGQCAQADPTDATVRLRKDVPALPQVKITQLSPAYRWIQHERVRGMFCYAEEWKKRELLEHLAAARFNTLIVHMMGQAMSEEGWPAEAKAWARVQQERKVKVFINWSYGSDERYGNTQFGAYDTGTETRWTHAPCPLSVQYWEKVIGERAIMAARAGLTGLLIDPEMYGADQTRYTGPCYCDQCWHRFVEAYLDAPGAQDLAAPTRAAFMATHGLADAYARWQEHEVIAILQQIRTRVHAVNPQFLLGNLADIEYLPGLARGLGTPTMPALIFGEREYYGKDESNWFNVSGMANRVHALYTKGYPAIYVPGLWIKQVTPPAYPRLAVDFGVPYAGYWVWSSAGFNPEMGGDYALAPGFVADDYWTAFAKANSELQRALATQQLREIPSVERATKP